MSPDLQAELLTLLRSGVLLETQRPVAVDQPLGAAGIGLDSLGVAEFLSAVEERHRVELPRWVWTQAGQLTLHRISLELSRVIETQAS